MRLTDLDPRWLLKDGQRVGFIFLSPKRGEGPIHWRQTCFFAPTPYKEQRLLVWAAMADQAPPGTDGETCGFGNWQRCNPSCRWTGNGAEFDALTVTPSLDGSAGGLWHGFITAGEIVGGL